MDDNPFHLARFVCDIQPWLNEVDADRLRQMVIKKHLISDSASIERLKRILPRDGQSAHNEELIKLLRAGGLKTYRDLSVVIEELGYVDGSKDMLSILSHTVKRGAQQQADSGAEVPTTKEPKKKFYENPFEDPDYVAKIDVPLKNLECVELRQRLQGKELLTQGQVTRLERKPIETHNSEMIGWIQSSHHHGYVKLCEVILEWGAHPKLLQDMNNLLQPEFRVKKG